jgi:hypothetical protein
VSNVHEVRRRVLLERLRETYRKAQYQHAEREHQGLSLDENTEMILRLTGLALTLIEQHSTNGKGHCLVPGCSLQRRVPWRKWRTCQVFVTALFWIEQSIGMLQQAELK